MTAITILVCLSIPPLWAWGFARALAGLEVRRRRSAVKAARPPFDYQL